jgi:REP element-mobilizing transposase RayT
MRDGFPLFDEVKYAKLLEKIIFKTGALKGFDILSYQIMPDHVHLLVNKTSPAQASLPALAHLNKSAPTEGCAWGYYNISQFMHTIKSYFCDQVRDMYGINFAFWQKRFYTRIVDTEEYFNTAIDYILQNPAKAELPAMYHYPPYQYINWIYIHRLLI